MTTESIIEQTAMQPPKGLEAVYEGICDIYRKRLCEQWDVAFEESWWIADQIGEGLCIADAPWVLDMPELRYLVDHGISEEAYWEYWSFVEKEVESGQGCPRINFMSWFRFGARPDILKKEENEETKSV